jgi:hypothetical protein
LKLRVSLLFDNRVKPRYDAGQTNVRGFVTNWRSRSQPIQVGDIVGYSKAFLQSTGQYTGDAPFARGKVITLEPLGTDIILAEIEWDKPDLPSRVNVKNLSTIRQISLGE